MEMQQRHYKIIAQILKDMRPVGTTEEEYRNEVINHFAEELEKKNQNFNKDNFIKLCYDGA